MTVGELKHQLQGANDNYELIVQTENSTYDPAYRYVASVVIDHGGSEVYIYLGASLDES